MSLTVWDLTQDASPSLGSQPSLARIKHSLPWILLLLPLPLPLAFSCFCRSYLGVWRWCQEQGGGRISLQVARNFFEPFLRVFWWFWGVGWRVFGFGSEEEVGGGKEGWGGMASSGGERGPGVPAPVSSVSPRPPGSVGMVRSLRYRRLVLDSCTADSWSLDAAAVSRMGEGVL